MSTQPVFDKIPVTIAISTSLSPAVPIYGEIVGFQIPDPVSWQTANLTFQASTDLGTASTFNNVYDKGGTEYTVTVGALSDHTGRFITLGGGTSAVGATFLDGITALKVRSGTAGAAVTQTAAQNLNIIVRVT